MEPISVTWNKEPEELTAIPAATLHVRPTCLNAKFYAHMKVQDSYNYRSRIL